MMNLNFKKQVIELHFLKGAGGSGEPETRVFPVRTHTPPPLRHRGSLLLFPRASLASSVARGISRIQDQV